MSPSLLLLNAAFYTQWPDLPWAEAVAIQHGRIQAVGIAEEILDLADDDTTVLDLDGSLVLPGFTDAHIHFHGLALGRGRIDLSGATSLDDALTRISAHAAALPPGAWVLGNGWNESRWPVPIFPNRRDLDRATGDRPAMLWRSDLHLSWVNSAALRLAGVGPETADPASGVVDKDDGGEPTGILRELAGNLVGDHIPAAGDAGAEAAILATAADLHRLGIVGVHDQRTKGAADEGARALHRYTRLSREGRLPLRITCNIEADYLPQLITLGLTSGFGDEWVQIGHVKLFADGSLGSHTAWMLESYDGEPGNTGLVLTPPAEVFDVVQKAHRHGCAISIHAIGDRANREVLEIFAEVLAAGSATRPMLPHRIEHVQTIQPEDLPRLAAMDLVASVQPIHCTDDIASADRYWGGRGANAYAFRTLLESGAVLAFGSDAPVASANPWWGLHAAVTRQRRDGLPAGGWYPDQRLTVAEAIRAYTFGPALAVGQAHQQGRIAPGYLADLVAVDRDLFTCDPSDIAGTKVEMTIVGGEIVYRA